ncbi:hypothetical protein BS78_09G103800 [Paspalum vaginatum]|nr:hypothetical protein BS78_09G103800 [Paspalum vaginatum]
MEGMRGSLLKGASGSGSTSAGTGKAELPLVDCLHCRVGLIKIRSKQTTMYGEIFIKCRNNYRNDPTSCGFIRHVKQYEAFLCDLV